VKLSFITVGCVLACTACLGPAKAPSRIRGTQPYQPAPLVPVGTLLANGSVEAARTGFLLVDANTGKVVSAHNADQTFLPASLTKVVVALTALEVLGPAHTFKTRLLMDGRGRLILKGGGDPHVTLADIWDLARKVGSVAKPDVLPTDFLFDDSALPTLSCIDPQQDPESTFNPPVSALSFERNLFTVHWRRLPDTEWVETFTVPPLSDIQVSVAPQPFSDGAELQLAQRDFAPTAVEAYLLSPNANFFGSKRLPLRKPALQWALQFQRYARAFGVTLPEPKSGQAVSGDDLLAVHESPPLGLLVEQMLVTSDNLMAELLGLAAAEKLLGRPPRDLEEAGTALLSYWRTQLPNVSWASATLQNGSGLTAANRLTPRQVMALLQRAEKLPTTQRAFSALLPLSGVRGTLSGRLLTPEVSGAVFGKTGTLDFGVGLAGQLVTLRGQRLLFVVMLSDVGRRNKASAKEAARWNQAARGQADELLRTFAALEPLQ